MSRLLAVTFEDAGEAARVRAALQDLERRGLLALDDAAVLVKDADGRVHLQDEPSQPMVTGAVVGGLMGVLLTFMFPIVGIVFGAGAGALIGRMLDEQIDKKFIGDVQAALRPGTSALFAMIRSADTDALAAALRDFQGHIYLTTLQPELERAVTDALQS